jgi:hypothetical protein
MQEQDPAVWLDPVFCGHEENQGQDGAGKVT